MEFFHPNWYTLLFWLVVFHFLADYPLQGDFLAQAKNPNSPLARNLEPSFPAHALAAHATIHGGFVMLATGVLWLALLEVVAHAWIDKQKIKGKINLNTDQLLHIATKLFIVINWIGLGYANIPPFN